MAEAAGGAPAVLAVIVACLLASYTSFAGALLALSRLTQVLAGQGVFPRALARVDPRRLVPTRALDALTVLGALAAAAIDGRAADPRGARRRRRGGHPHLRERPLGARACRRSARTDGRAAASAAAARPGARAARARRRCVVGGAAAGARGSWRWCMPVDFGIARWSRDVAGRQWPRDDDALARDRRGDPGRGRVLARAVGGAPARPLPLRGVRGGGAARLGRPRRATRPPPEALTFAAQQALDEARHHEMFLRRLTRQRARLRRQRARRRHRGAAAAALPRPLLRGRRRRHVRGGARADEPGARGHGASAVRATSSGTGSRPIRTSRG